MENKLKELFGECRIVGLAGNRDSGKTNNLISLIKNFREINKDTNIYIYGLNEITLKYIKGLKNVFEISSLSQLSNKKDSLIILDEFQRLRLNDRRYKELLNDFIDFICHNNNWVILSSPNIREFNSIIGGKIERWALKSIDFSNVVNGSQLKDSVVSYSGKYKSINDIVVPKNRILVINKEFEKELELDYIKEIDDKLNHKNIFV